MLLPADHDPRLARALLDGRAAWLLDEDGRPVAEVGSVLYDTVTTEIVACPYADARRGGPMNHSALRQLGSCWSEVLALARGLAVAAPTAHDAFAAALAATAAPVAFDLAFPDRPVPRALAALYKANLGMSQVLAGILLAADGVADQPLRALGDAHAFFAFLDQGRWLVGEEQVCAGPEPMIGQLFEAMAGGAGERAELPVAAPGLRETAVVVAGLQAATLLATQDALRRGDRSGFDGTAAAGWMQGRGPAWLRSVLGAPGRSVGHVARLFPTGGVPASVADFVAEGPASPGALDARLRARLTVEGR